MSQLRRLLPSLNTLVAFEAVMRCGTFAGAAKELGVTSPAVSRTIGRLELHLGLPLFDRTPAGVVPTRDGNQLFSGISRSFGEIEGTLIELKQRRQANRRPILLSVSSAFATHWFMPRLARFQASFPNEEVQFQLIGGPLGGPAGEADIAMRFDHKPEPHDHVEPLMPELVVPVGAPGCPVLTRTDEDPLGIMPRLITLDASIPDWSSLIPSKTTQPGAKELRFSDYSLVVQAALVGQGIALGWLNVVSHLLVQDELVPAGTELISTGRHCDLVVRRPASGGVIVDICRWMKREMEDDFLLLERKYPYLF